MTNPPPSGEGKLYHGDDLLCDVQYGLKFSGPDIVGGTLTSTSKLNQVYHGEYGDKQLTLYMGKKWCLEIVLHPFDVQSHVKVYDFESNGPHYECQKDD